MRFSEFLGTALPFSNDHVQTKDLLIDKCLKLRFIPLLHTWHCDDLFSK